MVGEIKIIYSKNFVDQLDDLTKILYKHNYFGFIEDADSYVDKIYHYVDNNIDKPISKKSPEQFHKYGKKYLKYKANQHTFWYIFFNQKDEKFLVNYTLNNHSKDFPELI